MAQERKFYEGPVKVQMKMVRQKDAITKGASVIGAGLIGYGLAGADNVEQSYAEGTLVVTNRGLYCAGNVFPYERILTIGGYGKNPTYFTCATPDPMVRIEVSIDSKHDNEIIRQAINQARGPDLGSGQITNPSTSASGAFCSKCGAPLRAGANFCRSCGARV